MDSRLAGPPDNTQGRNSSCPGGVPGLDEDSYLKLRSDFLREFKSMSALFQRCQPAPEVGLGRVSADEQDANLARINHDACQINERNTHDLTLL